MSNGSSIGVCGLLGVAFVVLKLTGVIAWSWWWITCPFWAGAALAIAGLALILAYGLIKAWRKGAK
jgi:hypothetical protein